MSDDPTDDDSTLQTLTPAYALMMVTGGIMQWWFHRNYPDHEIWNLDPMGLIAAGVMTVATIFLQGTIAAIVTSASDELPFMGLILRIGFHVLIPAYFGAVIVCLPVIAMTGGTKGWTLLASEIAVGFMGLAILRAVEKSKTSIP
jgi:hypothetical protein